MLKDFLKKLKLYKFEFRHLTVLLIGLLTFQIVLSLLQKSSLNQLLSEAQEWYQRDSAEKLASLTTTSFELLIENTDKQKKSDPVERRKVVQSFNIIFSQQLLQQNVQEICLLLQKAGKIAIIDDGNSLFDFLYSPSENIKTTRSHLAAVALFDKDKSRIFNSEQTQSFNTGKQSFEIMVPFVLRGEYLGVLYMKNKPDLSFFTKEITSSYTQASVSYTSLILLIFLSMFYISSYTVRERDQARKLFQSEHERLLKEHINHEKESLFTSRIYHTHHKAEKVMGFMKEDLWSMNYSNINEVKYRLEKYANFISRVIYDMKWYDPPANTIRNTMYVTNINDVITFLVQNIFLRISSSIENIYIHLDLDKTLPVVNINEYVVWEIIEPLIQNCIDHAGIEKIKIIASTVHYPDEKVTRIIIQDNGRGIPEDLLQKDNNGIQKIFNENTTTNFNPGGNKGYGCYIAYELARKKCGWDIEASNLAPQGSAITLKIKST